MVQDNFNVSTIMNDNELGVGYNVNGDCVCGGGDRGTINHGTSANSSSHAESSWLLNEFAEGAVTIEACSIISRLVLRTTFFVDAD